jgi:hypothetical protein
MESENIVKKDVDMSAQLIIEIENWYDAVLKNGRAFGQPVYEVGNWEEPNSPINVDGLRDVWGSLAESRQVGFRVENWTSNNSGVNYEIDVKEKGIYQVELGYSCQEQDLGSEFWIYTEYDTASLFIHELESAFSETLFLPAGRQVLHIELKELGEGPKGFEALRKIVVHRIPGDADIDVLKNITLVLSSEDGNEEMFEQSAATADFLYGVDDRRALQVTAHSDVSVEINADNIEQIETVTLFQGFDKIKTLSGTPFTFSLSLDQPGKHTVNVEIMTKTGRVTAVQGEINVLK